MRTRLIQEMLGSLVQVPKPLTTFFMRKAVMRRKAGDQIAFAQQWDSTNFSSVELQPSLFIATFWRLPISPRRCV